MPTDSDFRGRVYALVATIPRGRVMTYGDIALRCGNPRAARVVGTVAHYGPEELPWQRVVNRFGGMASGFWGGPLVHAELLRGEGLIIDDDLRIADFDEVRWQPRTT